MKGFVVGLLAIVLVAFLAACGSVAPETPEAEQVATAAFNIDPVAQSATLIKNDWGNIAAQQVSGRRILTGEDLAPETYAFAFLKGNVLEIKVSFKNVSACDISDLTFRQGPGTRNIIRSTEPTVTSADMGGDGILSVTEVTRPLLFSVKHKHKPFVYEVIAEAMVQCNPVGADLELTVDVQDDTVAVGDSIAYTITVINNGPITVTDGIVTGEITDAGQWLVPDGMLPVGCAYDNSTPGTPTDQKLACDLGVLAPGQDTQFVLNAVTRSEGVVQSVFELLPYDGDLDPSNNSASPDVTVVADSAPSCSEANVPDRVLRAGILIQLGLPTDHILTCADMEKLTTFDFFELREQIDPEYPEYLVIRDLAGLQHAVNLESLRLTVKGDRDLFQPLGRLANLTKLDIIRRYEGDEPEYQNNYYDFSYLTSLTQLKELGISAYQTDYSWLSAFINLERLSLGYNRFITAPDLEPLRNLSHLTKLWLNNNSIDDFGILAAFANLTELNLSQNPATNVEPLAGLSNLEVLNLGAVNDASPLESLTNLTSLTVWLGGEGGDFAFLSNLTRLNDLSVGSSGSENTRALTALKDLRRLYLIDGQISDIASLSGLTKLEDLSLKSNHITDISPLRGLTALKYLDIYDNFVSDLTPLSNLLELDWIYLENNRISDLGPLVANTTLGYDEDRIFINQNCLDRSPGSQAMVDMATLEARNPNYDNVLDGVFDSSKCNL